jgi:O-acetyl-ADP-ribose deacetylase (regulator of RNase III)
VPIERCHGDLLAAAVDALVNPVNTVGVMGKGLALQVKKALPEVFAAYARACTAGEVVVGRMHIVRRQAPPRFVLNFPTKEHWRQPSKLAYIHGGLRDLVDRVRELEIQSIAVPPLGGGLGGLATQRATIGSIHPSGAEAKMRTTPAASESAVPSRGWMPSSRARPFRGSTHFGCSGHSVPALWAKCLRRRIFALARMSP